MPEPRLSVCASPASTAVQVILGTAMKCVLVFSCTAEAPNDGLAYALESFGLQVTVVRDAARARNDWSTGQFSALFIVGADRPDRPEIVRALIHALAPRVGIVRARDSKLHPHLVDAGAEVIEWPVPRPELWARFELIAFGRPVPPTLAAMLRDAGLIGRSTAFLDALRQLPEAVRCDANVLICGETGTGKDLVARALHYLGSRRRGPFVPVNCAALPESLFENELFGHTRGAYTTAGSAQEGLAVQADTGTLFLDEVETLSARSQAALLRFLQDGQFRPLGAGASRGSNVRTLAASNANLAALAESGVFREDLYYRLNVLCVTLPPLRQRPDDIPELAEHVLAKLIDRYSRPKRFSAAALAWMAAQPWKGNVRELENWVHRRYLLAEGNFIEPDESATVGAPNRFGVDPFREAKRRAIAAFEQQYLSELIARVGGNVSAASRYAGTERRAFGRLLRKHSIDPGAYRDVAAGRPVRRRRLD